jgi:molybdopterin-synthase adenylyltransferase
MTNVPDRDLRQRDIVPPDRLAGCKATVVGVGAIGRQVALQLAAMGIPSLTLIDFDTVEPVNLACQGYLESDLNRPKVQATADLAQQLNPQLEVHTLHERFRRSTQIGNVLFCCVDKIETRQLIWDAVKDKVTFFADGRMSAETLRILVAADPASRKHYPTTLFAAGEAFTGACTAKTTIFCANIAAGLMLEQFARYLRNMPVDPDLQFNLLSSELTVTG